MGGEARAAVEYAQAIAVQGARFAAALVDGEAGDPDEYRGWRGQLQMAADFSGQDAELLTLADEVYAHFGPRSSAVALERFVLRRLQSTVQCPAQRFLQGALAYLETRREIVDLRF